MRHLTGSRVVMSDPIHKKFLVQRSGAKLRGIEWELPYWEWLQIWQDSGHLHERGTHAGQWVMGRNGDRGPYASWNVKIIPVETNNSEAQVLRGRRRRLGATEMAAYRELGKAYVRDRKSF